MFNHRINRGMFLLSIVAALSSNAYAAETRVSPSGVVATVDDFNRLTIDGTDANDDIRVGCDDGFVYVTANFIQELEFSATCSVITEVDVFSRDGNDTIRLGSLNPDDFPAIGRVFADSGKDQDVIYGSLFNDELHGGPGQDNIYGDQGNDTILGEGGSDNLYGEEGDDKISGGGGSDNIYGNSGNDRLSGSAGSDKIYGGDGHDILKGDGGDDFLNGEKGNDKLYGGKGYNRLVGGGGKNKFFRSR